MEEEKTIKIKLNDAQVLRYFNALKPEAKEQAFITALQDPGLVIQIVYEFSLMYPEGY